MSNPYIQTGFPHEYVGNPIVCSRGGVAIPFFCGTTDAWIDLTTPLSKRCPGNTEMIVMPPHEEEKRKDRAEILNIKPMCCASAIEA